MGSPSSVGVDDDLSAGEAGVAVRSANDETARGVQVVHGFLIEVLGRDGWADYVLHELLLNVLLGDVCWWQEENKCGDRSSSSFSVLTYPQSAVLR